MSAKRPREDPEATSLVCTLRHLFARMVSPKALLWCSGQTGGSKNLLGKPRPGSYPGSACLLLLLPFLPRWRRAPAVGEARLSSPAGALSRRQKDAPVARPPRGPAERHGNLRTRTPNQDQPPTSQPKEEKRKEPTWHPHAAIRQPRAAIGREHRMQHSAVHHMGTAKP